MSEQTTGPRLVRHATPEAVLREHWDLEQAGLSVEDLQEYEFGGYAATGEDGAEFTVTFDQMLEDVRGMGFWGFACTTTRTVHFWAKPEVSDEDLLLFFGHEIGHLSGAPIEGPDAAATLAEEARADSYGEAAVLAYQWLREVRRAC